MAYEFIAAGLRPVQPGAAFRQARDTAIQQRENSAINAVNIEGKKTANEIADIQLQGAKKQVDAEKAWAQTSTDVCVEESHSQTKKRRNHRAV